MFIEHSCTRHWTKCLPCLMESSLQWVCITALHCYEYFGGNDTLFIWSGQVSLKQSEYEMQLQSRKLLWSLQQRRIYCLANTCTIWKLRGVFAWCYDLLPVQKVPKAWRGDGNLHGLVDLQGVARTLSTPALPPASQPPAETKQEHGQYSKKGNNLRFTSSLSHR